MSTKTIYGFDDLGNKVPIGSYEEAQQVTIALSTAVHGGGSLECTLSGAGNYTVGSTVTISVSNYNSSVYYFQGWFTDGLTPISNLETYTFTATENLELTAYFRAGGN